MKERKTLVNREDVEFLVTTFYEAIFKDALIGFVFTEKAEVNWDLHFPVMFDFWESVLFGTGAYRGNPIRKHIALNDKEALTEAFFDRWIMLWETTVNTHFSGQKAEEAIEKARNMKTLMLFKIKESQKPNFIQ